MSKTKIICTLGPAASDPKVILDLVKAGMNVARINFSHGKYDEIRPLLAIVRKVSAQTGKSIGILGDLSGPKIRVGELESESVTLVPGETLTITTRDVVGTSKLVSTTYHNLVSDVEKDDTILVDDGSIELVVVEVRPEEVRTRIIIGGELKPRKGMNLPGVNVSAPAISAKDFKDIEFAVKEGFDFLALSFVRCPDDVIKAKKLIANYKADIPLIAKIEKEEAVKDFDAILKEADGIMIARGDLGVEMASQHVPLIQKRIIKSCNDSGKPVITATQMLESMIVNPRPTRAETSDVANAVIDGSDALMLSGETSVGKYPVKAVETMHSIIKDVERELGAGRSMIDRRIQPNMNIAEAVTGASCRAAELLKAKLIVAYTQSGSTAMRLSKYRPKTNILAITPSEAIKRRLSVFWGVHSAMVTEILDTDSMVERAKEMAKETGSARSGDVIVIVSGTPIGISGSTNLINVKTID